MFIQNPFGNINPDNVEISQFLFLVIFRPAILSLFLTFNLLFAAFIDLRMII